MNDRPLVSVVTPCYNDGLYLMESVKAIAESNYYNIEHIVIDDGSTDKYTLEVLTQIENEKRVTVIHTINQGVCKARNQAITASTGKYVLLVDSDDCISKEFIGLAVERLENNKDAKIVVTNYELFGRRNARIELEPYSMESLICHNLYTVTTMFRRADFNIIGGFNENMSMGLEDWDFWLSILESGGDVEYLDGYHFRYRIKPRKKSRNAAVTEDKYCKLRHQLWENHRDLYARTFLDPTKSFEYFAIIDSKEYAIGTFLLKPIRKLIRR